MNRLHRLVIDIPHELKEKFHNNCIGKGKFMTEVIRKLMMDHLAKQKPSKKKGRRVA